MDASSAREIADKANMIPPRTILYERIGEAISAAAEKGKYSIDYTLPIGITFEVMTALVRELEKEGFSAYCFSHSSLVQGVFPVDDCYHISVSWREYCED